MPRKRNGKGRHRAPVSTGRNWPEGERDLPRDVRVAAGIDSWKQRYAGLGLKRVARATPVAGKELEAENSGGGPNAGQAHSAKGAAKKGLKPAVRRELVREVRQTHQLSERLLAIRDYPLDQSLSKRRDPQTGLRMRLRELAGSGTRSG